MISLPAFKETLAEDSITPLQKEKISITAITPNGAGCIQRKVFTFSAGELQVRLTAIPPGTNKILVTAEVYDSQSLMELLFTLDAINHMEYQGPIELTLPYLPYSRQDRVCAPGESFALSVLVNCLVPYLGADDTLLTWDVHSDVAKFLFDSNFKGKFVNKSAASRLVGIETMCDVAFQPSTIVVAPDKGAVDRASEVQEIFGLAETVYATKVRNPDNGQILRTEVPTEVSYKGKNLLIVDDICDGGRTFIELAKVLRKYEPSRIDLYVTHGIFSKGFDVFEDLIDNFYVANVLPNKGFYEKLPNNLTFLRTAA